MITEDIETTQVEDVFAALGYTLFSSDIKRLLQDVGTNREGRVSIENLERAYASYRRCNTEHGKAMKADYDKSLRALFKLLMVEKRIPSTYRVKNLMSMVRMTGADGLSCDTLRNIMAQTDADVNVFDHEDISEELVQDVLKELITYNPTDIDLRSSWSGTSNYTLPEDAETISERDFMALMAFR